MKYKVGDEIAGGVCADGQWYRGRVEALNKAERMCFIRWTYERGEEEERTSWYAEPWVDKYIVQHRLILIKNSQFDERLFEI